MSTTTLKSKSLNLSTKLEFNLSDGKVLIVSIRCDDECGNGHDSFSITGDLYSNRPLTDRNNICGGCIHDEILKYKPEFKQFTKLHLSDGNGIPMYAVENGYYYYSAQYPSGKWFKSLCEHLRISESEGKELVSKLNDITDNAERKQYFSNYCELQKARWKSEAQAAITELKNIIAAHK